MGGGLIGFGLFLLLSGFVVFAFFLYHFYLVLKNTTTTETFKYKDFNHIFSLQSKKIYTFVPSKNNLNNKNNDNNNNNNNNNNENDNNNLNHKINNKNNNNNLNNIKNLKNNKNNINNNDNNNNNNENEIKEKKIANKKILLIKKPINIYNNGIWENLKEVFFPINQRKNTITKLSPKLIEILRERDREYEKIRSTIPDRYFD